MTSIDQKAISRTGYFPISQHFVSLIKGLLVGFLATYIILMNFTSTDDTRKRVIDASLVIANNKQSIVNTTEAEKSYREVRVLCWVMTNANNHKTKAQVVKETWGKRCNKLLFMSSAKDESLGAIALPVVKDSKYLWAKTKAAFKYIYEHHIDDADWFIKADDDTYTIVENLRLFLNSYSPEVPIYFVGPFKYFAAEGHRKSSAGYVLSKEAVRRLVTEALPKPSICNGNDTGIDVEELGRCLENVEVLFGDSSDSQGFDRFCSFSPETDFNQTSNDFNISNCSDSVIGLYCDSIAKMRVVEYFIYQVKPFGINKVIKPLPGIKKE